MSFQSFAALYYGKVRTLLWRISEISAHLGTTLKSACKYRVGALDCSGVPVYQGTSLENLYNFCYKKLK